MGNFCPYCGTPFTDGKCTCDLFKQNNPGLFQDPAAAAAAAATAAPAAQPAPQPAPAAQPAPAPQPAPQQAYVQPAPQAPAGENPFGNMFKLIGQTFTKPVSTPLGVEGVSRFSGIIFAGFFAVVAFMFAFLPVGGFDYYSASGHVKTAFFQFLVILGGVAAKAGIAKIFVKKAGFLDILGKLAMSTVYPACFYVASAFIGVVSYKFYHLFQALGVVAWSTITTLILLELMKDEKIDKKGIAIAACSGVCVLVYNILNWIF
ncbi:MAG: hypothetical protein J6X33_01675 [Clostridiales bacterium]|nr:hypothetical protein [Clostridiales bacterium]